MLMSYVFLCHYHQCVQMQSFTLISRSVAMIGMSGPVIHYLCPLNTFSHLIRQYPFSVLVNHAFLRIVGTVDTKSSNSKTCYIYLIE